jgi:signal transduction histidine kinase
MSTDSQIYWPDEPRRVFEAARLELARMQVGGESSLHEVAQRITELAARTLRVERVGIWVLMNERSLLRCYDLYERSRQVHSQGTVLDARDFPVYLRALRSRRDIPADLVESDPLTLELREAYLRPLGIVSMLDAPVYRGGEVIGVVCHEQVGSPRRWTTEERDFAASVADTCALKLETALRHEAEAAVQVHQDYLVEHQRMEALGRLAAGVAHDFKNLLHGILGFADLIQMSAEASPEVRDHARTIIEVAESGVALVKALLDYGAQDPQETRVTDVAATLAHLIGVLQAAAGARHTVELDCVRSGRVLIAPTQLERVVLNLVVNARDAMPQGGRIVVRVVPGAGEETVVVSVSDTGVGMDESTLARIFDPYFTTKGKQGTGLGLAIVQQIVTRCGGRIRVQSQPGRGTTFEVHLPRVAGDEAPAP